ncbi:MAG: glycine C-acetyltransferase [Tepidisphaeraceae bacterium]
MSTKFYDHVESTLQQIRRDGLYKSERVITTPQRANVGVTTDSNPVLNLCANNYLGLADHANIIQAAHAGLDSHGYGMASVRFICGTQDIHKQLERRLASFLGTDDAILYGSCFDANGGFFETLLGEEDAVISDQLNHASIIDGIRLCKARRFRYANNDLADLEAKLKEASSARFRLITTDGVFSMDGTIARLDEICDLADKYDALVHFDDCHATGFLGGNGRGTHEFRGCIDRIDITTGTLGKAVGGASGGYTAGRAAIVELLRQRSRPYLFSNSLAPCIVAGSLAAIDLIEQGGELRERLWSNTKRWRTALSEAGFNIRPGEHPITPVMFGDATLATRFADALLKRGVYAIAFSFPVVPQGQARIRTQMSAGLTGQDVDRAIAAFIETRQDLNV